MQILGLLFEVVLFAAACYLYFFSIGALPSKSGKHPTAVETFRRENSRWLRLLSLALMAIMFVNIFISLRELMLK
ncbi:MAG: hypothetical protein IPN74_04315 [Haliscomenobacter sp.]|nr:hypothetical protein [Haliscomenobacter sp.]